MKTYKHALPLLLESTLGFKYITVYLEVKVLTLLLFDIKLYILDTED